MRKSLLKAAEILEFVDTPKDEVRFTELGKKFINADSDTRETPDLSASHQR